MESAIELKETSFVWTRKALSFVLLASIVGIFVYALAFAAIHNSSLSLIVLECDAAPKMECTIAPIIEWEWLEKLPQHGFYLFHRLDSVEIDHLDASEHFVKELHRHQHVRKISLVRCGADSSELISHVMNCKKLESLLISNCALGGVELDRNQFHPQSLKRLRFFGAWDSGLSHGLFHEIIHRPDHLKGINLTCVELTGKSQPPDKADPFLKMNILHVRRSPAALTYLAERGYVVDDTELSLDNYSQSLEKPLAKLFSSTTYLYFYCLELTSQDLEGILRHCASRPAENASVEIFRIVSLKPDFQCLDQIISAFPNISCIGMLKSRGHEDLDEEDKTGFILDILVYLPLLSIKHYPVVISDGNDYEVELIRDTYILNAVRCVLNMSSFVRMW